MESKNSKTARKDFVLEFSHAFLAGGSSALLLSAAHLHDRLWFISLFALVPYLWRLRRTCFRCSILLGAIFAFCFSFIVFIDDLTLHPYEFCLKLFVLISIFSVFGAAVNRVKKHIEFYPVFIAALWMPLEYFLLKYVGCGCILDFCNIDSSIIVRFGSLFGLLIISFFAMLVNSFILFALENAAFKYGLGKRWGNLSSGIFRFDRKDKEISGLHYTLIDSRGPPT